MTSYAAAERPLGGAHVDGPTQRVSPRSFKPAVGSPAESGGTEPSLTGLAGPTGPRLQPGCPLEHPRGSWAGSNLTHFGQPGWGGATTHGEAPSAPSALVPFRVEGS